MKRATFVIQGDTATVTFPSGNRQTVRVAPNTDPDLPGYLYVDNQRITRIATHSHEEARRQKLTSEEWDYDAISGEIASYTDF